MYIHKSIESTYQQFSDVHDKQTIYDIQASNKTSIRTLLPGPAKKWSHGNKKNQFCIIVWSAVNKSWTHQMSSFQNEIKYMYSKWPAFFLNFFSSLLLSNSYSHKRDTFFSYIIVSLLHSLSTQFNLPNNHYMELDIKNSW